MSTSEFEDDGDFFRGRAPWRFPHFYRHPPTRLVGHPRLPGEPLVLVAGGPPRHAAARRRRLALLRTVRARPPDRLCPRRYGPGHVRVAVRRVRAGGVSR